MAQAGELNCSSLRPCFGRLFARAAPTNQSKDLRTTLAALDRLTVRLRQWTVRAKRVEAALASAATVRNQQEQPRNEVRGGAGG